jgi:cephalosporin hydroxylase
MNDYTIKSIEKDFDAIINKYRKEKVDEYLLKHFPDPVGENITKHVQDIIKYHGVEFVKDQLDFAISKGAKQYE